MHAVSFADVTDSRAAQGSTSSGLVAHAAMLFLIYRAAVVAATDAPWSHGRLGLSNPTLLLPKLGLHWAVRLQVAACLGAGACGVGWAQLHYML